MNIKLMAIAAVLIALFSFSAAYEWQENHYENVIAQQQMARLTEVKNLTDKVLVSERKNNDLTNQLNDKSAAQMAAISSLRSQLASYRNSSGSLLVAARCSDTATSVADAASIRPPTTSAGTPAGVCQLPAMLSEFLIKVMYDADSMRNTVEICRQYAEAIDKQRKEMYNSKN